MLKKFVLGGMVVVAALLGNACGDDASSDSPAGPADSEVTLSSSSDDVIPGNSSSSSVTESPSTSSGQAPQSAEPNESSSSEKAVGGSSSSDEKSSSSSGKVESSSSGKGEKSSSSEGAAGSSSVKVEESSSSAKVDDSSSSVKSAESSSSVKTKESSSSDKKEVSSSSEKPVESSSSEKVVESSSSEKSSSSAGIPSKLYDCEIYKCVTTKYLNPDIEYGEYLDVRDSQVYRTVQIGEQVWMAQNLNYSIEGSFCFSNNSSYCNTGGRLYQWSLARNVCPNGWHLPDTTDFGILRDFAEQNNGGISVGNSLKSGKNDVFGFAGLVNGGYQTGPNGKFSQYERQFYWTDTADAENEDYAEVRYLEKTGNYLAYETFRKTWSLSVRCIKD